MSEKTVIAVASGKGGVGKSTTAVNLAVALRQQGARVGLLDADVYGPNVPMMMGVAEDRPAMTPEQHLIPFEGHGVKVMSIAFLVDPGKAVIWRGPMLHNLLRQFINNVQWGDLDYLLVDLPPGTGDAPLSLVQLSISMFQEVKVPVLGLIENMSGFYCAELNKVVPMFHGNGGQKLSEEYQLPLLGQIPFDPAVGDAGDRGTPITIALPDSVQAKAFRAAAAQVAQAVQRLKSEKPTIEIG
jgi:ATP-binding protein involved in chromosome partitioning